MVTEAHEGYVAALKKDPLTPEAPAVQSHAACRAPARARRPIFTPVRARVTRRRGELRPYIAGWATDGEDEIERDTQQLERIAARLERALGGGREDRAA